MDANTLIPVDKRAAIIDAAGHTLAAIVAMVIIAWIGLPVGWGCVIAAAAMVGYGAHAEGQRHARKHDGGGA